MTRVSGLLRGSWISLAVLVLLLVGSELGFRALASEEERAMLAKFRAYLLTGTMPEYEPQAFVNYRRPRESRTFNAFGFQDVPWNVARTSGVPRIACLGGSTTEGGNERGLWGSYPYLLEQTLEARTGRDFEVMDAGMSGWTSAEMLVAWFLSLQDFDPDVVVLHEAVNDLVPRFLSSYRPDYTHWRVPIQQRPARGLERLLASWSSLYLRLRLRDGKTPGITEVSTVGLEPAEPMLKEGKLPHETSLAFRRNIASIARAAAADGRVVVLMTLPASPTAKLDAFWHYGIAENNTHLRELGAAHGYLLADADEHFRAHPELAEHFLDAVHLQPPGNQAKAELVADALAGWTAALAPVDARPPRQRKDPGGASIGAEQAAQPGARAAARERVLSRKEAQRR
jgi:lysophospholipase L1-like esterase